MTPTASSASFRPISSVAIDFDFAASFAPASRHTSRDVRARLRRRFARRRPCRRAPRTPRVNRATCPSRSSITRHLDLVRAVPQRLDVREPLPRRLAIRAQPVGRGVERRLRVRVAELSARDLAEARRGLRELGHRTPRASAVARCTTRTGDPTFSARPAQVHQAPRVGGDDRGAVGSRELVVRHRQRDLGLPHRERPAEPAAEIRPRERDELRAGRAEQPPGLRRDPELAKHVARVVVGDPAPVVPRQRPEARVHEEGRQLPDLERLDPEELGKVVRRHRRARPRGNDHGQLSRERLHEGPRHPPRSRPVPGVEGGLPATDLAARKLDVVPRAPQQGLGVGDRVRKREVAETGREELHRGHARDSRA